MSLPDERVSRVASTQHGLFTSAQAMSCGLSRRGLDHRVERGLLTRRYPSVFALAGAPVTASQDIMASVLSMNELAAASHATAAYLLGMLNRWPSTIEVVVRRWERRHRTPFTVHESLDLVPDDIDIVDGIPTTSAVRTVVDLGAVARRLVPIALDAGLRLGLFEIPDVRAFLGRVARKGRRGVGVIRPLLDERDSWRGSTESPLEDRFRRLLAKHFLPQPELQYVLTDDLGRFVCRADFAYSGKRTLVEIDSETHHLSRASFHTDREKQNRALALGWRTLRFTKRDLDSFEERVLPVLAYICDS